MAQRMQREKQSSGAGMPAAPLAPNEPSRPLLASLGRWVPQIVSPRFAGRVVREAASLAGEAVRIAAGTSEVAPGKRDRRFQDGAWTTNPVYHRLMQLYLTGSAFVDKLPDLTELDWRSRERARFMLALLTEAMAPTNTVPGNPVVMRKTIETRGASLVRGARNAVQDLRAGRRLPRRSDPNAFRIGEDLAATTGAVIFRNEIMEVLQYTPSTETVRSVPLLFVSSYVNKFYVFDLDARRSFVKYCLDQGFATYLISWRDPSPEQAHWGMDAHVSALLEAIDVVTEVAGAEAINLVALCGGSTITAEALAYMAANGDRRANTATQLLAIYDSTLDESYDLLAWLPILRVIRRIRRRGLVEGRDFNLVLRLRSARAMIWPFWTAQYLMGESPGADTVLFWGDHDQNFTSGMLEDQLQLMEQRLLLQPNAVTVLGTPVDVSKVDCDTFVTGALHDYGTPWKGSVRAAEAFGGDVEFVLCDAGHVQSVLPGRRAPYARYAAGGELGQGWEHWLSTAEQRSGSWWPRWAKWLVERSPGNVPAPTALGSRRHPPMEPAPGTYVTLPPGAEMPTR
jgi:polyhydroxyalkanoate synthase subunit PhaC